MRFLIVIVACAATAQAQNAPFVAAVPPFRTTASTTRPPLERAPVCVDTGQAPGEKLEGPPYGDFMHGSFVIHNEKFANAVVAVAPAVAYPPALAAAGTQGRVSVRFWVNRMGCAEPASFRVTATSDAAMAMAVREAMRRTRFKADSSGGGAVWSLVEQWFEFTVPGSPNPPLAAVPLTPPAGGTAPSAPPRPDQPYFVFQVEKPATSLPGTPPPKYPPVLRESKVTGDVLVQFVVDTAGVAEMDTFRVLKSSHELFSQSVRAALAEMRFSPAVVLGRKVRQLVQMPFVFALQP